MVAPLRAKAVWFANREPRAIVFVVDPERSPISPERYLRRLYNLTRAEAAVAAEVLEADGLQAVAGRLGVSLETVRTHLAHVFAKTGTRRQAELVRLLLQSQPAVRDHQAATL